MIAIQPKLLLASLCAIALSSCKTIINAERIDFNRKFGVYDYPIFLDNEALLLRDDSGKLINHKNYENFLTELDSNKYKYPIIERTENEDIKFKDYKIAQLYESANKCIKDKRYSEALAILNKLKESYPDIIKYSDCLFLKGLALQKLDSIENAKNSFEQFLDYSTSQYSKRFRGYNHDDLNDSIIIIERDYAYLSINDAITDSTIIALPNFKAKYHYNSYLAGFNVNQHNYSPNIDWFLVYGLGLYTYLGFVGECHIFKPINSYLNLTGWCKANERNWQLGIATPIQAFQSKNNQFGIKISPFANFFYMDSIYFENKEHNIDISVLNFGAKISMGYYFMPRWHLGASFKYNYYGNQNKIKSRNNIEIWFPNEYELSLYFDTNKEVSYKVGVLNKFIITSLIWSGWEIGTCLNHPFIFAKIELF